MKKWKNEKMKKWKNEMNILKMKISICEKLENNESMKKGTTW